MPDKRSEDCPAALVCDAAGKLWKGCISSKGLPYDGSDTQKCIANLILLIGRLGGIVHVPPESEPALLHEDSKEQICKKDGGGKS